VRFVELAAGGLGSKFKYQPAYGLIGRKASTEPNVSPASARADPRSISSHPLANRQVDVRCSQLRLILLSRAELRLANRYSKASIYEFAA